MTAWDYKAFWIGVLAVGLVLHAALTGPPGSLMAKALTALARALGWTK